jgi:hypothetical protein
MVCLQKKKTDNLNGRNKGTEMQRYKEICYKIVLISIATVFFSFGCDRVVPKNVSLETGYKYVLNSDFSELGKNAVTGLLDYAWQVSGLDGSRGIFITIPLGYTYLPAPVGREKASILAYGWTIRHEVLKKENWGLFLGYGLLLNQLFISSKEGRALVPRNNIRFA